MTDNSAAPFLHRLPMEVLHLVFAQLCGHCRWEDALCAPVTLSGRDSHWMDEERYLADTQDLRSLCLVSSALRGPAQSVLHHMCMGGFGPDFRFAFRYTQLFRFVGYVAANDTPPRLVREVKALSLGHGHLQKMPKLWRRSLAMPEAAHLRAFMASESNEPNEITKTDFIAKLITTFPFLTHLSLGECADDSSDRVPSCLAQVEELPLTSNHLAAVAIARSKGLRMLAVDCCIESATRFGSLQPRPSLAQLRVLRLTSAWLEEEELRQTIAACPILCGLAYSENGYGPRGGAAKEDPTRAARGGSNHTIQWRTVCGPISNEEHDDDDETRPERFARALEGLAAAKAHHNHRLPHLTHVGCDVDAMMDSSRSNRPDHENLDDDDVMPDSDGSGWSDL
ncbi:hypothetical protein PG994_006786 [Apiospora phragmitis]|uniref:F-box domain-containing protein n=1 Tax=Apiospora phragmitis TaxID=2905665 RepID=A0ABR1VG44_9PEZI